MNWRDKIEPETGVALHSIAISLKRIADAIEQKNIKQPIVMSAEEYSKFQDDIKAHNKTSFEKDRDNQMRRDIASGRI
jgi:hypothetical protein